MRIAPAAIAVLMVAAPVSAQRADPSRPVGQLPSGVTAAGGRFTIHADYAGAANGTVAVYLVNRSSAPVDLDTQDGTPYLVREAELGGAWVRTEPFVFSDCGLSYYSVHIRPGRFVQVSMPHRAAGEPARVRYRLARYTTPIVSNIGAGFIDRREVRAATHDALAMESADAGVIATALAGPPALDSDERRAAFQRLGTLPAAEATPILLRILGDGASSDADLEHALRALHTVDRAALVRHVGGLLERPPSPLRARTLSRLRYAARLDDAPLYTRMLALVAQPGEPDLQVLMQLLASGRDPGAAAALGAIAGDARYTTQDRLRASYELEQWFGTESIDAVALPEGSYGDGHRLPVRMRVRLTNTSGRAVELRYAAPTDVLALYVTRGSGSGTAFIEPRSSVRWFTRPPADAPVVRLAPGEVRELPITLSDYFELRAPDAVEVWVSVRIPGLHDVPDLGPAGTGVNVQP